MSDEYGRQKAFNEEGLVDESLDTKNINPEGRTLDERYRNYPLEGDTTSSGGFSTTPEVWSDRAQRGNPYDATKRDDVSKSGNGAGLVDQSVNGGNLKEQVEDAKQGKDM
ncbi:hypothetical protein GYMLUDRAFT_46336 [Collybiopsis luxurians FD-317 M1]|uniref:Uncharacterized protein n=1 Tax=Collybiopsis luxurians FD-317 M1 TaxID=944289 RepID=A0A0D0CGX7_9AGAR|nr:hypothetical protein GYMLUDRAFT_46336 [Collybiopsis luxurians FD-317 M1]